MIDSPKSLCTRDTMTIKVTTCPSNPKCVKDQDAFLVNYYKQTHSVLLSPFFSTA